MTQGERHKVLDKSLNKAIANGWAEGEKFLVAANSPVLQFNTIIFEPGFGRAFWGEETIELRDVKTTRGNRIIQEAWRFHQHIILDFLQLAREDLAYEYLAKFLE